MNSLSLGVVCCIFDSMKKRLFVCFCALLCAVSAAFAVDIDVLVNGALENSGTIRNLEVTKENSSLSAQMGDLSDETKVTVDTGSITLEKGASSATSSDQAVLSMQPSVTVSVAGLGDDTSLELGVSNSSTFRLGDGTTSSTLTPNARFEKSFDLSGFVDGRDDIVKQTNALQRELSYAKGVLEFKNSVINSVISIMNTTVSIETTRRNLESSQRKYESDISLGVINEGSLSDMKTQMELSKLQSSLDSYETQLETLKRSFYNDYGVAYEDVDFVRDAVLDVVSSSDGNTTVAIARLNLEKARQNLDAKTIVGDSLKISSSLQAPVVFSSGSDTTASVKAGVGAEISGSNYAVSASANAGYDGSTLTPSLTISGRWSNKTNAKASDLEILTLENDLILAQMSYDSALQNYDDTVRSLSIEVQDLRTQTDAFEIETQYNRRILEYTTQLYEKGMASQSEMDDAKASVAVDDANRIVYALKALVLENRIRINEL